LSGYIFATKAYIGNQKKILNSNISSRCPHNMVNFSALAAEIVLLVWGTPAFSAFIALLVAEFCEVQNSLCVQNYRSPILAALLHDTPVVGVSQTLRR